MVQLFCVCGLLKLTVLKCMNPLGASVHTALSVLMQVEARQKNHPRLEFKVAS
jgi:hypothetical protein